ncbi:MAG: phenylalanine--tRNA ligase subunit beta [Gammaproteobacteria bacterium]
MKISESWLREWVNPELDTAALAETLTMAGLEVDSIEPAAAEFSGVIVAEILSAEPHPDADKLRVCEVNTGADEPVQIVCGAANAAAGLKTALATVGAVLPGNLKIKQAKLRGVPSFGMLCGASELGLSGDNEGLIELADDAPIGTSLRDYLLLDDHIIDIDLTPNRGDCLGMEGIAREVGTLTGCDLHIPDIPAVIATTNNAFPVQVKAPEACPRYLGREIIGIDLKRATTPVWMRERLRRGGIRSIDPVVDVSNYVMLELGQPMHAFDQQKLQGSLVVRFAQEGEKLTLLDDSVIDLKSDTVLIADQSKPLALAGVMGGKDSGISTETSDLFLEVAYFTPQAIAGQARSYGLNTDSAHRFERGVDPHLSLRAIERATALLLELVGGRAGPVIDHTANIPDKPEILLRRKRIQRLLGFLPTDEQIDDILQRLGMRLDRVVEGWRVTPPSARFDIAIEADLIEEVGRVYGYNNIPVPEGRIVAHSKAIPESDVPVSRLKNLLVDRGYQEAITYCFVDTELNQKINPALDAIKLKNPISSEMSVMRTGLWAGLLEAMKFNIQRQQDRVRLFEYGLRFIKQDTEYKQINTISGVVYGSLIPPGWAKGSERKIDYFDVKSDVEALLALADTEAVRFEARSHEALHPGQSAAILDEDEQIGWLGRIHPALAKSLEISTETFLFEINADRLLTINVPSFEKPSRFPSIRRDLSVVVDVDLPASTLMQTIRESAGDLLKTLNVFDIYQGDGIESGRKSIAFSLILQDYSRTLADADVDSIVANIMNQLQSKYAAVLRE